MNIYQKGALPLLVIILIILVAGGAVAGVVYSQTKSDAIEIDANTEATNEIEMTEENTTNDSGESNSNSDVEVNLNADLNATVETPLVVTDVTTNTKTTVSTAPVTKTSTSGSGSLVIPTDWVTFTGISKAINRDVSFKHPADIKVETLIGSNFPSGPRILGGDLYPCEMYVISAKTVSESSTLAETKTSYGMTVEKYNWVSTGALGFYYITTGGDSPVMFRVTTPGKGPTVADSCNLDLALKIASTIK